jgi:hypothetical protein
MPILLADILPLGASGLGDAAILLFALLIGHALADFPLQGEFLAAGKEMHGHLERLTGTTWPQGMWAYCLTFHSLIHGGAVWIITGSVRLGALELILHWLIDCAKSARLMGFYLDQSLHILCKLAYVYLLIQHRDWFFPA